MKDRIKVKLVEMVRFEKIQISKLFRDVRRKSLGIIPPTEVGAYLLINALFQKDRAYLVIKSKFSTVFGKLIFRYRLSIMR